MCEDKQLLSLRSQAERFPYGRCEELMDEFACLRATALKKEEQREELETILQAQEA